MRLAVFDSTVVVAFLRPGGGPADELLTMARGNLDENTKGANEPG